MFLRARSCERLRRAPAARPAYTLIEVMIVLSILTVIAGISWPALMRPWSRSLSQQAAQDFTSKLLDTHLRAIEESRVYRLRWRPGTGEYEILSPAGAAEQGASPSDSLRSAIPDSLAEPTAPGDPTAFTPESNPSTSLAGPSQVDVSATVPVQPLELHATLPHGVQFSAPATALDPTAGDPLAPPANEPPGSADLDNGTDPGQLPAAGEVVEVAWSEPVWFYPDGLTSNARWSLISEDGYQVEVFLRGLTGTVRVGPVRQAPALPAGEEILEERTTPANEAGVPRGNPPPRATERLEP